jgi:hypothetical protein
MRIAALARDISIRSKKGNPCAAGCLYDSNILIIVSPQIITHYTARISGVQEGI